MVNSNFYNILLKEHKDIDILDILNYKTVNKNITKLSEYSKLSFEKSNSDELGNNNLNNLIL